MWEEIISFISDYRPVGNIFRSKKHLASKVQDARRSASGLRSGAKWALLVRDTQVAANS